ncbi:permease [Salsuginibacillus kocurii]|uniref:permease n=1 Tax=Salsuginibacillus kocurii TaxID=427078 RepID=UPI0003625692|nr:permease [Salsuginibacillus kocurii]
MSRSSKLPSWLKDGFGIVLLLLFILAFFNIDTLQEDEFFSLSPEWLTVNTIFLGIVIEAIPFLLLGVFVSSLIQVFVAEDTLQRFLPKNAYAALFPAAVLGAIFPICECAIVPVVRRLIKKGMPLHVGVVFLVGAPILNPVVAGSTYFAFRNDLSIFYTRFGLAFVLAIIIGGLMYILFKNSDQLKWRTEELRGKESNNLAQVPVNKQNRLKQTFYHASDEFFLMGKYLIAGALIAAMFQTFLDRSTLLAIGTDAWTSTAVMMVFAYILSLCSEADAFVASSFSNTFSSGSLVGFLVYGPMLDLKNTIMLFAFFKAKFVIYFMISVTVIVYAAVMITQFIVFL